MIRTITTATLLAAVGIASADTAVLIINPAQSSINIDATLLASVGDQTDSASSTISGMIEIELDDYTNPSAISIVDFLIIIDDDIVLAYDYGFLGNADANLSNVMAMYGTPGMPTGPIPAVLGEFNFPAVPSALAGDGNGSYDFLLVGSDTVVINLADLGLFDAPIAGNVSADGTTVNMTATYDIDVTQELVAGVADIQLVGTANIVATGPAPQPGGCNAADIAEPFDVLDLADIGAFVAAFTMQQPAADIAEPFGVYDLADLGAFITAFTAGCP